MPLLSIAAIAVAATVFILLFLWASFVSASPGEIKVISGPRGQRVLHGKTGWKVPLLERVDTMTASMISVDAQTTDFVPTNDYINVRVDAGSSPVEWCNRFVSFGLGYALSWSGVSSCPVGWGVSRDLVRMSRLR